MFYITRGLTTTLRVEPNYLDMLKDPRFVLQQIKQKVEGKYYQSEGYIILVTEWLNNDRDKSYHQQDVLVEEDGSVSYKVYFEAIAFQLKKFEIVDCVCTGCNVQCLNLRLGPIEIVIGRGDLPHNYKYFAQTQCYKNEDQEVQIEVGSKIRAQIVQVYYKNGLRAVAKLVSDGINDVCGPVDDDLRL